MGKLHSSALNCGSYAGAEGIEPPSKVLETPILPLNYAPYLTISKLINQNPSYVRPPRIELGSMVPQTITLSVKLWAQF